jgi:uncharacterized protein (DUF983 family)
MTTIDRSRNDRPIRPAVLRGFKERCPACGEGRLFGRYLKVNDHCPECGENLSYARADDGPAYFTVLVVCHVVGFALHVLYGTWRMDPMLMALIISLLAVALSLVLLPRFKGMLIAIQWCKRLHGF